ncbi:MAG: NUDIX hydrolase [Patescibacteria group bacterium]
MVRQYSFHFSFDPIPPNLLRNRHALIVMKDAFGNYVLGRKNIYPKGMFRFVGGGIKNGEDPVVGAQRELFEELGLCVLAKKLHQLAEIHAEIISKDTKVLFITYLFFTDIGNTKLKPSDDLDGIDHLTVEEMHKLIQKYTHLSSDLVVVKQTNSIKESFRWSDYGAFYSQVHKIGLELTENISTGE